MTCSNWAVLRVAAGLSPQNPEAAPPLLHKELFTTFSQNSVKPDSVRRTLNWRICCCREAACCHDHQHHIHRWVPATTATNRWSTVYSNHIERITCPNRNKFNSLLPWSLDNMNAKWEANKMSGCQDMCSTYRQRFLLLITKILLISLLNLRIAFRHWCRRNHSGAMIAGTNVAMRRYFTGHVKACPTGITRGWSQIHASPSGYTVAYA